MKPLLLPFALTCILVGLGLPAAQAASSTVAFVDVTVIPMDSERVVPHQTVIVTGDRITGVGPSAAVNIPGDARRIEGKGRFLIPGLGEMHGHNLPPGTSPEQIANIYFLFAANGVTTIRSMLGWPGDLELREKARQGGFLSPTLHMASPSLNGRTVRSAAHAVELVRQYRAEGWDLLKVHGGLPPETFEALAHAAREAGISFGGHIPTSGGLVHALERGQKTIDHLDGYLEYTKGAAGSIDPAKLAAAVKLTRDAGAGVVPTMVFWEKNIGAADFETIKNQPEFKYMPPAEVERWRRDYEAKIKHPKFDQERVRRDIANRKIVLKALSDGGVTILFGSDAPQQFSVPGFSVHREMRAMADAGMSPFQILQSATKNVGAYFQATDKFGAIAAGNRADLILLEANPLADIGNVARRTGVMVRGRWLPESEIQERLEKIARSW